jgi:hypothetical protein
MTKNLTTFGGHPLARTLTQEEIELGILLARELIASATVPQSQQASKPKRLLDRQSPIEKQKPQAGHGF